MRVATDLPHRVVDEETWLTLHDRCRIALRIRRPADAAVPAPAILEYLPYRKRDLTAERDAPVHNYFAGHGYACVRADIRGTGDSDGVLADEYLPGEQEDGLEILRWIAGQPWCNGRIGMMGISWGGFAGLQLAARQPPELGAVIAVCASDDRYADDIHHMGGCMLGDNLSWAASMFDYTTCPPDPALVGDRWRAMWHERLEASRPWIERWLEHQRRDAFWKQGSVCEDYAAIRCPVFAVSGWADGYTNAVFRLLANLSVPRKGLVGPWAHKYPHAGAPGPQIGFLQECLRFFDHWLGDRDNGVMDEPMLRAWMQDPARPSASYRVRPGRWVAEPAWPSPNLEWQRLRLTPGHGLVRDDSEEDADDSPLDIQSPLFVGLFAGKWCASNAPPDLPHDQRDEDGGALVFETDRLTEAVEILGQPTVELDLAADRPVAMVAVRLIDVAPDDAATRVSFGLLNLTHRDSDEHPEPLEPGRRYRVTVALKHIAQRFEAGHAIRVSISTVYWPVAWPSPEPVKLTIRPGRSVLALPLRTPRPAEDAALPAFDEPEGGPPEPVTPIEPTQEKWEVTRDLANDLTTLEVVNDEGVRRFDDIDLEVAARVIERYTHAHGDHDSLRGWCEWVRRFRRQEWETTTITRILLTSDRDRFRVRATLDAYEGDTRVFSRSWDRSIPRDLA